MNLISRAIAFAALVAFCATAAAQTIIPPPGQNFDGTMSLIYNDLNGGVFLENSPLPNPAVQTLSIASSGSLLLPGNLNVPALSPAVTVTSQTSSLIEMSWSSGNFLGTGSFLGQILNPSIAEALLQSDLSISYTPNAGSPTAGDLIWGSFGQLQSQPVLPNAGGSGFFRFFSVASGQFFDPPVAYGYTYEMDSASLFTKVGLPLGLGTNFTISSSEGTVSNLPEGGMHVFGGGVLSFTLTGISPPVDPGNPAAFPLYLEFATSDASFHMTALTVPEPASVVLAGLALLGFVRFARRQ